MNEPQISDPLELARQVEAFKQRSGVDTSALPPRTSAIVSDDAAPLEALPGAMARLLALCPPKTDAEMRQWEWTNTVLPNLVASRLPERFHYEIHGWKEPKQYRTLLDCRELLQRNGAIVAMIGERGVGKTTVAAQLIIERAWNAGLQPWERRPPYRKLTDLIAKFKPLYADFGSTQIEALMEKRDWLCRFHPFLVIDELHECDDQRMRDRVLTDILDRRYANRVDTLLISNQSVPEFTSATSDSVLSRLKEHGRVLVCKWKSFR